jgi:hypothetical protein
MKALLVIAVVFLGLGVARAQDAENGGRPASTVEERIRQGLNAADSIGRADENGIVEYAPALGEDDVSLQAPTGPVRLPTGD